MNLCLAVRREMIRELRGESDPRFWDYVFIWSEVETGIRVMTDEVRGRYSPNINHSTRWAVMVTQEYLNGFFTRHPELKSRQVMAKLREAGRSDPTGEVRTSDRSPNIATWEAVMGVLSGTLNSWGGQWK